MKYIKDMGISNIKVSYTQIKDDLDVKKFLQVNYYKLGIVLDLDCIGSGLIFKQVS